MKQGQASRAAPGAAGHRAAHQALDGVRIFSDPLALVILGDDAEGAIAAAKERSERRPLRLFIAMGSRLAEDAPMRDFQQAMAAGVAARGEAFQCSFDPPALHERARRPGFADIEDLDRAALAARFMPGLALTPRSGPGGHIVRIATR